MADLGTEAGNIQAMPRASTVPAGREVLKKQTTTIKPPILVGIYWRDKQEPTERIPMDKAETIWEINCY